MVEQHTTALNCSRNENNSTAKIDLTQYTNAVPDDAACGNHDGDELNGDTE